MPQCLFDGQLDPGCIPLADDRLDMIPVPEGTFRFDGDQVAGQLQGLVAFPLGNI